MQAPEAEEQKLTHARRYSVASFSLLLQFLQFPHQPIPIHENSKGSFIVYSSQISNSYILSWHRKCQLPGTKDLQRCCWNSLSFSHL